MSTCDKITDETIILLAFGEESRAENLEHLAVCADCQTRVDEVREVRAATCGLGLVEPPAKVVREVRRAAANAVRSRKRFRVLAWRLVPATAVAALALMMVYTHRPAGVPAPAADDIQVALIRPLNLDGLETDLNRDLDQIGVPREEAEGAAGPTSDMEADPELDAILPAGDEEPADYLAADDEESIDQLEVELVKLETDLGLTVAGDDPAKGE